MITFFAFQLIMKNTLGFRYNPDIFDHCPARTGLARAYARFQQRFPEYIWGQAVADGRNYTLPQIRTVLENVTEGGSRLIDKSYILNQRQSLNRLISMVQSGQFNLEKEAFCSLHDVAAKEEALLWGTFRTGMVGIAGTDYKPPTHEKLDGIFNDGISHLKSCSNPLERAVGFFLFGTRQQFFYDANKRTAGLMMNGILLASGWDALVVPATQRPQYNSAMLPLYDDADGEPAIKFLLDCYRTQD